RGATLRVYIEVDATGQGRDALLQEGVNRWVRPLADRGITLETVIGDPPAGATNPIRYTWEADGFTEGGQTIGAGEDANQAIAGPDGQQTSGGKDERTGSAARIRDELPATTADDKSLLRNPDEPQLV